MSKLDRYGRWIIQHAYKPPKGVELPENWFPVLPPPGTVIEEPDRKYKVHTDGSLRRIG